MDNQRNSSQNQGKKPGSDENFQWSRATKTLLFWLMLFVFAIFIATQFNQGSQEEAAVSFDNFLRLLEDNRDNGFIEKITIKETELVADLKGLQTVETAAGPRNVNKVRATLPDRLTVSEAKEWRDAYQVQNISFEEKSIWGTYLLNLLPWILLAAIWLFFLRRMQGGGGARGIFNFGRSKAKLHADNEPRVTFEDVAGADEAKQELREIIEFLKEPEKFQKLGGRIPKGALLLGPPGTGKTLLAKAVAGEAGVPFFSMSGADFVEMFVGVGASRVRDLFEQGKKNAPCIIFIDEVDAVGRHRGAGLGGGHDEREQTLNQLLVEMDGFESNEGVILIAATNRPDVLDSALLRPGRFDRQIVVGAPDIRGREGILRVHTKNIAISRDVDFKTVAKATPGFSGADLANMVNEAALLAARKNKRIVDMSDLEEAKDKIAMGVERKSMILSDNEKRLTAYHEAGHALVSKFVPEADPVHKVTIIPRGRALGVTNYLPQEKHSHSRTYLTSLLATLLGGREAERLILKEITSGAASDIDRATDIARRMVCDWGMSDKLGPLAFGKKQEEIFLGREIAQHRDFSERTAEMIDDEVKNLIAQAEKNAQKILSQNIDALHRIAKALLDRETISSDELEQLVNDIDLAPKKQVNGAAKPVAETQTGQEPEGESAAEPKQED